MRNFFVLLFLLYAGSAFPAYPVIVKNTDSGSWPGDTKITSATMTADGILSARGANFLTPPTVNGSDVLTTGTRVASSEESDVCTTATFAVLAATAQAANTATTSTYAIGAGTAYLAYNADNATTATYATNAGASVTATSADIATTATYSTNAGTAASASVAETATTSTYATSAGSATTATYSDTCTTATYALNAGGVSALSELTDVSLTSQTTGQGVGWNGSTWTNMTLAGETGATGPQGPQGPVGEGTPLPSYTGNAGKVLTVDTGETTATWQMASVGTTLPSYAGKPLSVLMVNDTATALTWQVPWSSALSGMSDVSLTTKTTGQVLAWNGSVWTNTTGGDGGSATCYTSSGTLANGASVTVTHAADPYPNYKRTAQIFTRTTEETLLLHMDTLAFPDETGKTVTNSGVTTSTTQSKFGGVSGYFSSATNFLSVAGSTGVSNFGTGDFTIDFWIYPTVINSTNTFVFQGSGAPNLLLSYGNGTLGLYGSGGATIASGSCSITANNWYHVAATGSGTTHKLFLNGTSVATATSSTSIGDATNTMYIGNFGSSQGMVGYYDEVRFVKGLAKWTANFTPETSAYSLSYICTQVKNFSSSYVTIDYLSSTTTRFTNATSGTIDFLALVQILP